MRELTETEMHQVAGGDGFHLGGNKYISNTRRISGGLGMVGAATLAFDVGYAVGTGMNWGAEQMFGSSLSDTIGGTVYGLSQS